MNLGFLYFVGFLIIAFIIGLAIIFIRMSTKEQPQPSNRTLLDNYMPQYAHGYSSGVVDSIETSKTTTKIVFFPRDQDLIKIVNQKEGEVVKPETLYVLNKNVVYHPAGSWSTRRNRIAVYPPVVEEIPEAFKEERVIEKVAENEMAYKGEKQLRKIIESQSKIQDEELPHKMMVAHLENLAETKDLKPAQQNPEVK